LLLFLSIVTLALAACAWLRRWSEDDATELHDSPEFITGWDMADYGVYDVYTAAEDGGPLWC
jgi:hypothetical protein